MVPLYYLNNLIQMTYLQPFIIEVFRFVRLISTNFFILEGQSTQFPITKVLNNILIN